MIFRFLIFFLKFFVQLLIILQYELSLGAIKVILILLSCIKFVEILDFVFLWYAVSSNIRF